MYTNLEDREMTTTEMVRLIMAALSRRSYPQIVLAHPVGGFDMHPITHKRAESYKADPSFIGVFSRKTPRSNISAKIAKFNRHRRILETQ